MQEITSFTAHCAPLRVWDTLSDLRGYRSWHPHYQFPDGPGEVQTPLSWLLFTGRRVTITVIVTRNDKPRAIGWQAGQPGLLAFDEHYEIAPAPNGASIRHFLTLRGVLGDPVGRIRRRAIRDNMAAQDTALLTHLDHRLQKWRSGPSAALPHRR